MSTFLTEMYAIEQITGELILYAGPNIIANTMVEAEDICVRNYPYLRVIGRLDDTIITDDFTIVGFLSLN